MDTGEAGSLQPSFHCSLCNVSFPKRKFLKIHCAGLFHRDKVILTQMAANAQTSNHASGQIETGGSSFLNAVRAVLNSRPSNDAVFNQVTDSGDHRNYDTVSGLWNRSADIPGITPESALKLKEIVDNRLASGKSRLLSDVRTLPSTSLHSRNVTPETEDQSFQENTSGSDVTPSGKRADVTKSSIGCKLCQFWTSDEDKLKIHNASLEHCRLFLLRQHELGLDEFRRRYDNVLFTRILSKSIPAPPDDFDPNMTRIYHSGVVNNLYCQACEAQSKTLEEWFQHSYDATHCKKLNDLLNLHGVFSFLAMFGDLPLPESMLPLSVPSGRNEGQKCATYVTDQVLSSSNDVSNVTSNAKNNVNKSCDQPNLSVLLGSLDTNLRQLKFESFKERNVCRDNADLDSELKFTEKLESNSCHSQKVTNSQERNMHSLVLSRPKTSVDVFNSFRDFIKGSTHNTSKLKQDRNNTFKTDYLGSNVETPKVSRCSASKESSPGIESASSSVANTIQSVVTSSDNSKAFTLGSNTENVRAIPVISTMSRQNRIQSSYFNRDHLIPVVSSPATSAECSRSSDSVASTNGRKFESLGVTYTHLKVIKNNLVVVNCSNSLAQNEILCIPGASEVTPSDSPRHLSLPKSDAKTHFDDNALDTRDLLVIADSVTSSAYGSRHKLADVSFNRMPVACSALSEFRASDGFLPSSSQLLVDSSNNNGNKANWKDSYEKIVQGHVPSDGDSEHQKKSQTSLAHSTDHDSVCSSVARASADRDSEGIAGNGSLDASHMESSNDNACSVGTTALATEFVFPTFGLSSAHECLQTDVSGVGQISSIQSVSSSSLCLESLENGNTSSLKSCPRDKLRRNNVSAINCDEDLQLPKMPETEPVASVLVKSSQCVDSKSQDKSSNEGESAVGSVESLSELSENAVLDSQQANKDVGALQYLGFDVRTDTDMMHSNVSKDTSEDMDISDDEPSCQLISFTSDRTKLILDSCHLDLNENQGCGDKIGDSSISELNVLPVDVANNIRRNEVTTCSPSLPCSVAGISEMTELSSEGSLNHTIDTITSATIPVDAESSSAEMQVSFIESSPELNLGGVGVEKTIVTGNAADFTQSQSTVGSECTGNSQLMDCTDAPMEITALSLVNDHGSELQTVQLSDAADTVSLKTNVSDFPLISNEVASAHFSEPSCSVVAPVYIAASGPNSSVETPHCISASDTSFDVASPSKEVYSLTSGTTEESTKIAATVLSAVCFITSATQDDATAVCQSKERTVTDLSKTAEALSEGSAKCDNVGSFLASETTGASTKLSTKPGLSTVVCTSSAATRSNGPIAVQSYLSKRREMPANSPVKLTHGGTSKSIHSVARSEVSCSLFGTCARTRIYVASAVRKEVLVKTSESNETTFGCSVSPIAKEISSIDAKCAETTVVNSRTSISSVAPSSVKTTASCSYTSVASTASAGKAIAKVGAVVARSSAATLAKTAKKMIRSPLLSMRQKAPRCLTEVPLVRNTSSKSGAKVSGSVRSVTACSSAVSTVSSGSSETAQKMIRSPLLSVRQKASIEVPFVSDTSKESAVKASALVKAVTTCSSTSVCSVTRVASAEAVACSTASVTSVANVAQNALVKTSGFAKTCSTTSVSSVTTASCKTQPMAAGPAVTVVQSSVTNRSIKTKTKNISQRPTVKHGNANNTAKPLMGQTLRPGVPGSFKRTRFDSLSGPVKRPRFESSVSVKPQFVTPSVQFQEKRLANQRQGSQFSWRNQSQSRTQDQFSDKYAQSSAEVSGMYDSNCFRQNQDCDYRGERLQNYDSGERDGRQVPSLCAGLENNKLKYTDWRYRGRNYDQPANLPASMRDFDERCEQTNCHDVDLRSRFTDDPFEQFIQTLKDISLNILATNRRVINSSSENHSYSTRLSPKDRRRVVLLSQVTGVGNIVLLHRIADRLATLDVSALNQYQRLRLMCMDYGVGTGGTMLKLLESLREGVYRDIY